MFGLGLTLTVADFSRVCGCPKAVLVALGLPGAPAAADLLRAGELFDLAPALAVGMMLLAASPGGTTANLFSHLAGGDVALNVTLTAVNSVLAVFTLPIVVNLSLNHFLGDGEIGLQPARCCRCSRSCWSRSPSACWCAASGPAFAERMARPVKIGSMLVLALVIFAAIYSERDNVLDYIAAVGAGRPTAERPQPRSRLRRTAAGRLGERQSIACSMEIGIHNATLADHAQPDCSATARCRSRSRSTAS